MKNDIRIILSPFNKKISWIEIYDEPKTVKNAWIGNIDNCIGRIEILTDGVDEIVYTLRNAGYIINYVGREIYIKNSTKS